MVVFMKRRQLAAAALGVLAALTLLFVTIKMSSAVRLSSTRA